MASPYLTKPIRTVEQVMAERLRRPVPVGSRKTRTATDGKPAESTQPQVVMVKSAEGGGD